SPRRHPPAEHAIACPDHRLTTAQVRAGAPLGPALVWTATTDSQVGGDTISSNGVPAWYDQNGEHHAARAWTWQHRATGRSGSPAHPGFDTAYLPLDQPTNGTRAASIIGALRDGRRTAAHRGD